MDGTWQSVLSNQVSQACLESPSFALANSLNGTAQCAYKVPTLQHAQTCCLAQIVKDPQDECTYICPGGMDFSTLTCLNTILGSLDPQQPKSRSHFTTPMTGRIVQMLCHDHQGQALPNVTYPMFTQGPNGTMMLNATQFSFNESKVNQHSSGSSLCIADGSWKVWLPVVTLSLLHVLWPG